MAFLIPLHSAPQPMGDQQHFLPHKTITPCSQVKKKNTFPSTVKCHSSSSCVKCHSPLSSLLSVPAPSITIPYNLPQFTCHAIAQYHILALGKAAWTLKDKNIQWEWISDGYQHPPLSILLSLSYLPPYTSSVPEYQSINTLSILSSLSYLPLYTSQSTRVPERQPFRHWRNNKVLKSISWWENRPNPFPLVTCDT